MNRPVNLRTLSVLALLTCLAATVPVVAGDSDREDRWQLTIPVTYVESQSFSGQGGSTVDLSRDLAWGIGFGYNFDEHWYLGFETNWISAGYLASIPVDTDGDQVPDDFERVGGILDAGAVGFVGQYNFLEKTVTPFVRASVGSTFIDSNIAAGPPQGICWWYPFWGYVCDVWQPTYSKSVFSYGAAIGVRADVNDRFFLEGTFNQHWADAKRTDTLEFTGYRLAVGWTF